ncbi:MAG: hypothetical protein R2713_12385 [Ilumatobacteraceae bacterium]
MKQRANEHTGQLEPLVHPKGQFRIPVVGPRPPALGLYYTRDCSPAVVKHSLAELLDQDGTTTRADEILQMTICEPALGSGAFLNEAINQLAAEYCAAANKNSAREIEPDAPTSTDCRR